MIELRQLVGRTRRRDGKMVEKKWNVDQVLRDGEQVGTIGRFTGAKFCPLSTVMLEEVPDIVKAIAEERAKSGAFGPPADVAAKTPNEPIRDLIEEEDDDLDD